MSHSLYVGQRVHLQLKELENQPEVVFTITGFSKYNQFDMNGNEYVHILFATKQHHFTDLTVHFSLLKPVGHS
jgi:NADPH-dependent glutamate synthase beta subunit-like oxidoreductase